MTEQEANRIEEYADEWLEAELQWIERMYISGAFNGEHADLATRRAYDEYREMLGEAR